MWSNRAYLIEQLKFLPLVIVFATCAVGMFFAPFIIWGAIATVLWGMAVLMFIQDRLLGRSGRRVEGVVVDHQAVEDCFIPIIEFWDYEGKIRREAARTGTGERKPPVGSRVVVLYDPTGKRGCELDRFWRRNGVTLLLLLFGILFTIGAVYGK